MEIYYKSVKMADEEQQYLLYRLSNCVYKKSEKGKGEEFFLVKDGKETAATWIQKEEKAFAISAKGRGGRNGENRRLYAFYDEVNDRMCIDFYTPAHMGKPKEKKEWKEEIKKDFDWTTISSYKRYNPETYKLAKKTVEMVGDTVSNKVELDKSVIKSKLDSYFDFYKEVYDSPEDLKTLLSTLREEFVSKEDGFSAEKKEIFQTLVNEMEGDDKLTTGFKKEFDAVAYEFDVLMGKKRPDIAKKINIKPENPLTGDDLVNMDITPNQIKDLCSWWEERGVKMDFDENTGVLAISKDEFKKYRKMNHQYQLKEDEEAMKGASRGDLKHLKTPKADLTEILGRWGKPILDAGDLGDVSRKAADIAQKTF